MKKLFIYFFVSILIFMCMSDYVELKAQKNNDENKSKVMTAEIMWSLKRINDFKISPDGKWVLYSETTPDIPNNKMRKKLNLVSVDGSETRTLVGEEWAPYNGIWSPDGQRIAFISSKSGQPQVYRMDFPSGSPEQMSDMENGVSNLNWSPDGQYFSFTSEVKLGNDIQDIYKNLPKVNARMYDKLPARHWDEWEDNLYSHVFIMNSEGGETKDLTEFELFDTPDKPFDGVEQINWSPDGKEISYSTKRDFKYYLNTNTDIYSMMIPEGKENCFTVGMPGYDKAPLYSPDGQWIAFLSMERAGYESDRIRLMLYNRQTRQIMELSKSLDQWVEQFVWAPDSKSIFFTAADGSTVQIYNVNVPDGNIKKLTSGQVNYDSGLEISKDGSTLVVGRRNMLRPTELYTLNTKDLKPIQLTKANDEIYKTLSLPTFEERLINSTDGNKIHTWVIYPPNFDKKLKYPMITYCQGGPQSTISQYFSYRWNFCLMASQGYVVVAPNRRGVPGFGQEWNDAIRNDWGGKPMQDILDATDAVMKEPYINNKAVAAVGASYGGYSVYWLAGNHNKRFCAFIAHSGIYNMESKYGSTEELWFPNWEFGGPYWEEKNKPFYDKNSPHKYTQNWDTPILVITGEKDFRVPYTQALEAFTAAQVKGLFSKLITFPEENHWILKPQNSLFWHSEFFKWLDRFCKNKY